MSEEIGELAAALVKVQAEIKDAEKTSKSYNGKYAALDLIYAIIRPCLSKHGIAFKQDLVSQNPTEIKIQTWLIHSSGQYMMSELTVAVPAAAQKTNALQQVGIAASYARRYAIMGAVGITQKDEDDDADSFTDRARELPKAEPYQPEKPQQAIPLINIDQETQLIDLIKEAGATNEKVLLHCQVKQFSELTIPSFIKICDKLQKKIEEAKKVAK